MSEHDDGEVIGARPPDADEQELIAWAEQAKKSSINSLQEGLKQMVTLTSALLAGSAAFYAQLPVNPFVKGVAAALLMLALASALRGWLPRFATFDLTCIEEIREARRKLEQWKTFWLTICGVCLWFGFLVLLAGLILEPKAGSPETEPAKERQSTSKPNK
jgi:hypothetical protein